MHLISSPRFNDHLTPPGHPESPERGEIFEGVAERARERGVQVIQPRLATDEELLRVHSRAHVDLIEATRGRASMIDEDTFTSPDTAEIARLAAGAAVVAVEHCLVSAHKQGSGDSPGGVADSARGVAMVRPPGHHAEAAQAMGFCFYNNVAVAAAHARALGAARVAIVDFDVHHGNGTQQIFYESPDVLFVSTHQYPFYPGTGAVDEMGDGRGRGYTINIPMPGGATDGDYLHAFEAIIVPAVEAFTPDLILVSAGFDAHERDPLGQMRVTTEGFGGMTSQLRDTADRLCGGRLVLVSEGGYDLQALAASLDTVCGILDGQAAAAPRDGWRAATGRADAAIAALRTSEVARWAGL
jgi:acetoin utilization deacetylase AcuC-like enzyme